MPRYDLLVPRSSPCTLSLNDPIPERFQPLGRILRRPRPFPILPIDVNGPESGDITFFPFEIVDERPGHVSVASHPLGDGFGELFEVSAVIVDPLGILQELGKGFEVFVLDGKAL
jgi:hypothetical protein